MRGELPLVILQVPFPFQQVLIEFIRQARDCRMQGIQGRVHTIDFFQLLPRHHSQRYSLLPRKEHEVGAAQELRLCQSVDLVVQVGQFFRRVHRVEFPPVRGPALASPYPDLVVHIYQFLHCIQLTPTPPLPDEPPLPGFGCYCPARFPRLLSTSLAGGPSRSPGPFEATDLQARVLRVRWGLSCGSDTTRRPFGHGDISLSPSADGLAGPDPCRSIAAVGSELQRQFPPINYRVVLPQPGQAQNHRVLPGQARDQEGKLLLVVAHLQGGPRPVLDPSRQYSVRQVKGPRSGQPFQLSPGSHRERKVHERLAGTARVHQRDTTMRVIADNNLRGKQD